MHLGSAARRVRATAIVATLGLIVGLASAGCSSSSSPAASSSASGGSGAETSWQRVLDQIQPDGSVSVQTALAAFATAIGPVPGGQVPSGPADQIFSGTLAVNWVLSKWSQLSAAQRQAVRADLGLPAAPTASAQADKLTVQNAAAVRVAANATTAPSAGSNPKPNLPCATADSAGAAPYRAMLGGIENDISTHLGRILTLDVYVELDTRQGVVPDADMYSYPCNGANQTADKITGCVIHIEPGALVPGYWTMDERRSALLHEVMHCFLYNELGAGYYDMEPWYVEGVPTWAMSVLTAGNPTLSNAWIKYVDTPSVSLFARSYVAVGFYTQLADSGTDVWHVIDPIGKALLNSGNSNAAGWNAAGVLQHFLDDWGSGYATGRYPDAAWNIATPASLPQHNDVVPATPLADGASAALSSAAGGTAIEQLNVTAQVVTFAPNSAASGRISLGGSKDVTLTNASGVMYCTLADASACACPSASPGAGTTFTHMDAGPNYLTVTGGANPASVTATGMTLANACKHSNASCLVGTWHGTGFSGTAASGDFTASGGAGLTLRIDPVGNFVMDFDGMQSASFSEAVANAAGTWSVSGQEKALIALPAPGATSGTLTIRSGQVDMGNLAITMNLTAPIAYTFGPMSVSQFAAAAGASGGSVSYPGVGDTWQCHGNGLTINTRSATSSGVWTFTK